MITIERVVTVDRPVETVFAYLSDFETTVEWEPGTVSTVKVSGDGGVGTKYANTSSLAGRQTELEYVVQRFEPAQLFQVRGENRSVNALGTLTLRPTGDGTEVTYRAEVEFKGVTRLLEPLLKPQLKKLADDTQQGMHKALQNL